MAVFSLCLICCSSICSIPSCREGAGLVRRAVLARRHSGFNMFLTRVFSAAHEDEHAGLKVRRMCIRGSVWYGGDRLYLAGSASPLALSSVLFGLDMVHVCITGRQWSIPQPPRSVWCYYRAEK